MEELKILHDSMEDELYKVCSCCVRKKERLFILPGSSLKKDGIHQELSVRNVYKESNKKEEKTLERG